MAMTQDEIDAVVQGSGPEKPDIAEDFEAEPNTVSQPKFTEMDSEPDTDSYQGIDPKLELLYDLQLPVSIELGKTNMLIRNILKLGRGSVIEFDKLVSEPVDVLINGKKVAEGEVVVIDKHFGIRITTLVDPSDRLRTLRRKGF